MTVDYDLIVVGGAIVGRYAALRASQFGARVALIEPPTHLQTLLHPLLTQLNEGLRQQAWLQQWSDPSEGSVASTLNWQKLRQWTTALSETLEASSATAYTLPRLATAGVEVIGAEGCFVRRPQLGFAVNDRLLRSRAYLLAPATQATIPEIEGLKTVNWIRLDALQQWQSLPRQVLILGRDPRGIVLAQVLNRLGSKVTLITSAEQLLPGEDMDAAVLLQAQLEAEGVIVLTQTQITQIRQLNHQVWVQAGNRAIEAAVIVLATQRELALSSLNLEAAEVKWQPQRIFVNHNLQTTHPRIYACGESLGGYAPAAVARYEAEIALHNALFLPTKQVDYRFVPWTLLSDPQLVGIGFTETQAKQHYGKDVLVARQPLRSVEQAQISDNTTGFLKLIARRNGELLGAHCVGANAIEWMGTIAFAMQHHLKLAALAQLPSFPSSLSDLIQQTAVQLQEQRRTEWQRELLETWFNFRRSR